jgi:hypothetical protein
MSAPELARRISAIIEDAAMAADTIDVSPLISGFLKTRYQDRSTRPSRERRQRCRRRASAYEPR